MKTKEKVYVKANWRFVVRDAKTGEVKGEVKKENVLTTIVKQFFAQAYGNGTFRSGKTWYLVLGTGSGTPAETDTALFTEVPSTAKTGTISVSGNTVQFYVRYLPEEANGYTYTEAGIYDNCDSGDYTTGSLINHVLIEPEITKDSSILLDVYVTITFP